MTRVSFLAVGAAVGRAAAGQPRHARQRADRRVASVAARRERAVFRLPRRQIGQALVDSRLGRRHHRHTGGLGVLGRHASTAPEQAADAAIPRAMIPGLSQRCAKCRVTPLILRQLAGLRQASAGRPKSSPDMV